MNWPHALPQPLTLRSENTFWLRSLKIRLLMSRVFGPAICVPTPSA
jgi:hypothetical protein